MWWAGLVTRPPAVGRRGWARATLAGPVAAVVVVAFAVPLRLLRRDEAVS